ncbi:uroporphyrinogen decarboxylase family protein [Vallitalea guaymasensis]|uniref:uroporphyrinogen decarboxylase family protein n=1 Tax=Vallitalea guaymasensis TaxID=1185412 RepID=UPI000DE54CFA|nr:uroporphyrinogen decarboxylase family protein [Vallitalea guaymasensis]
MINKINYQKAVRFERPDYIPMTFHINDSCWEHYPQEELFELMETHKFLFPDFKRPEGVYKPVFANCARKDKPFVDDWDCLWETSMDGITGTVTKHPLADWGAFTDYKAPDPTKCMGIGKIDWDKATKDIKKMKENGDLVFGGLRHGHTFLQLCDIRGYQNLIFDMVDNHPNLVKLIDMVEEFNSYIVNKYLEIGVDVMGYAEDLGMQKGPMISPDYFKQYIKPSYERLMKPARDKGVIVHMHSDGDLHDLIDDLIDGGVEVINMQDNTNGVDWIADKFAGKVCIELDIDRQFITPNGTPKEVDTLIREEVEKIGRKEGGLMMIYGLYPGIPLENVKALMDAMEKYAFYY